MRKVPIRNSNERNAQINEFIRANFNSMEVKEIAERLGVTCQVIRNRAFRMDLSKAKRYHPLDDGFVQISSECYVKVVGSLTIHLNSFCVAA